MSSSVDVEVRLKLKDGASAELKASAQLAEKVANQVSTATERAAQRSAEAVERSATRQRSSYEKMSHARETLGIRSERAVQREIQQTEAAYSRLQASGTLSIQQQTRAFDAMKQKVTALNNEMGKFTAEQQKQARLSGVLRTGGTVAAGGAALLYSVKGPAEKAMSYDLRLAHLANTTYSERDAAGRIAGMKTLESSVNKAWRFGGGTREQAADALDTMIASGTVNDRDAMTMLPGIMKASTASGTDAKELATIAIRAKQNFKIKSEDLPQVLAGAMAAGQAGGFELKDMAKWLPQQMAMAGNLGISGKEGFAKLAAWNQASVITAGTKDEAGNNLRDLLNEVNTPHFRKFMGEQYLGSDGPMKKGAKEKRMKDIDAIFLDYQSKGVDKVSATVDLAEKIFAKDKTYQSLQAKLKTVGSEDKDGRRSIIESMAAQVQGTAVGKIFHNQQSLMAFLSLLNNKQYSKETMDRVRKEFEGPEEKSATSVAHEVISSTASYKAEQAGQEAATAQKNAMDRLTPAIGLAADAFSAFAQKSPVLTAVVVGAVPPLIALASAAGMASVALGGKPIPGGAALDRAGKSSTGKWLGRAVGAGVAWEIGHDILGPIANWGVNKAVQFGTGNKDQTLGSWIYDKLHPDSALAENLKPPTDKPKLDASVHVSVSDDRVSVKSTKLDAYGVNAQMNTGNLMTGAPR